MGNTYNGWVDVLDELAALKLAGNEHEDSVNLFSIAPEKHDALDSLVNAMWFDSSAGFSPLDGDIEVER